MKLLYPENGAVVDTHTPVQNTFIETIREKGIDQAQAWLKDLPGELPKIWQGVYKYGPGNSIPQPTTLSWENDGSESYRVELSQTPDFANPKVWETRDCSLEITNLYLGAAYYWRVNGCPANRFTTKDSGYRFIRIDGLMNVRDLGGIAIKQGMVYRGSEVDWECQITEAGKEIFARELGIKTEVTLRVEKPNAPQWLKDYGVRYACLPYRPYMEVFEDEHRKNICALMDFFADENNYPTYIHCHGGADRTGIIALYLRALAGESDEDILIDYELTSLSMYSAGAKEGAGNTSVRSRTTDYFSEFYKALQAYAPGKSLKEQVRAFLLECGVKEETLEKIVQILKK